MMKGVSRVKESKASAALVQAGRASAHIGRGLAGGTSAVVRKGWQAAADPDDEASGFANEAVSTGMHVANQVRANVGKLAGAGSRAMRRGRTMPARQTRAASRAQPRPKASERLKKAGAKTMKGARLAGRGMARVGKGASNRVDGVNARLVDQADDQSARIAALVNRYTARSPVYAARTARFAWRHRKAPVKAARATVHGVKATGHVVVRTVQATAAMVRVAVAAVSSAVSAAGLPLIAVAGAVLAVVSLVSSFGALFSSNGDSTASLTGRAAAYAQILERAGSVCPEVTPALLAAQVEAESNWDPHATSGAGARGIAQFMPSTWASAGMDGDGDGHADIDNPIDAIWSQGNYMCSTVTQIKALQHTGAVTGDTVELALAAYNAGLGAVSSAHGMPSNAETRAYVPRILALKTKYEDLDSGDMDDGGQIVAGSLKPALRATGDLVDITGIDQSAGASYAHGQCTWWAAIRRAQIGRPVDPYMGNGGSWDASARRLGMKVTGTPHAGDAICFHSGVLGADGIYGHIAVVENVGADGSITISEANARGIGVVNLRHISAMQLKAAGAGVAFIQ